MPSAQDLALEVVLNTYFILTAAALTIIFLIKELLRRIQRPKITQVLIDPKRFFDLKICSTE